MTPRLPRLLGRFLLVLGAAALAFGSLPANAAQATVGLGTAGSFAVLAGSQVTNTGDSVINGNLGVSPGTAITGFPPGIVNGTIHRDTATARQAQADTTTAYNDAAGRKPATAVATELGGRTLKPGVYRNATLGLTGTVTLDAEGDPGAVFIFQTDSTLITASSSRVAVINGAQACNVFWQVGSSATLGTTTDFVGTVLALTSITANNGATVHGRLLARNGAVTLDNNTITRSVCATSTTTTTEATTTTTTDPTTTTTTEAITTTTTAVPATSPTTAAPTGGTDATVPGAEPDSADTGTESGPAAPTGDAGTTDSGGTTPGAGTGGGDSSTAITTTLPRTGSGLTELAVGGVLAMLLGAVMLQRSRAQAR